MLLTRLLYPVEHVKQNIKMCILENKKMELSYWLAEYYYSGFQHNCMDWLIQIYYCYYALQYPCFEKKLHSKLTAYNTSLNYEILIQVANNLRIKESSLTYQKAKQQPKQINRGRKPSSLSLLQEPCKSMLFLYIKKDWNAFYHQLNTLNATQQRNLYVSICVYTNKNKPIDETIAKYYSKITQYYSKQSIIAMIFALCLHLTSDASAVKTNYGLWLPDKKTLSLYKELEPSKNPYQFLKINLKYKNRQSLEKNQLVDILTNWLFYSYNTPLWRDRIDHFHGYPENNAIKFTNDEDLESFYDKYGYELDEQSNEIYSLLYSVTIN